MNASPCADNALQHITPCTALDEGGRARQAAPARVEYAISAPLCMAYVPRQTWAGACMLGRCSLRRGTVFQELRMPFFCEGV